MPRTAALATMVVMTTTTDHATTIERAAPRPTSDAPSQGGRPPRSRVGTVGLVVVTLLSLGVVGYAIVVYGGFDPEATVVSLRDTSWHYALLMAHIATGAIALALGPFQFIGRLRARHPRIHRWIGRTYLFAGVFPSAIVGIPVAILSVEGPWASAGLLFGDIIWLATAIIAYRAARQRRYREHGMWMTWNFALTFSAVTFRIWLGLLIGAQVPLLQSVYGGDFDALFTVAYSATAWLAFLPNVLIVMVAQRWVRARRRARAAAIAAAVPVTT